MIDWPNGKPAQQPYPLFVPRPAPAPSDLPLLPCGQTSCMSVQCRGGCARPKR